jgi:hypothetical protein
VALPYQPRVDAIYMEEMASITWQGGHMVFRLKFLETDKAVMRHLSILYLEKIGLKLAVFLKFTHIRVDSYNLLLISTPHHPGIFLKHLRTHKNRDEMVPNLSPSILV